jgi:mRNA interferase MazF
MGLLSDSVIMTDNLATILDSECERVIGRCDDMRPIDAALRVTFGLES